MREPLRRCVFTAALAGVIASATLAAADDPVGPTKPVVVVNTEQQPVPVTGTLVGTVTVANAPSVHAVQSGPWAVGAAQSGSWVVGAVQSGTWTVGVSGPVTVSGPVEVQGTVRIDPQAPLPVQVQPEPLEPFQADLLLDAPVLVPAGKRLVIETVTVLAFGREDSGLYQAYVRTSAAGHSVQHLIATVIHPFTVSGEATDRYYQATAAVRLYADPGTEVEFSHAQSGTTEARRVTVSGHLVAAVQ
jgi:hypothetical protein